jgi:hypothetical protein
MEQLPYIDDYARQIDASPAQVWHALITTLRKSSPKLPDWLTGAWGLQHPMRTGAWDATVGVGDTLPGFAVAEIEPPHLLTLRGRHRFSDYELRFELEQPPTGGTRLQAKTSAAFPGLKGRAYRALVIGTRGHRIAVLRILAYVARTAERRD